MAEKDQEKGKLERRNEVKRHTLINIHIAHKHTERLKIEGTGQELK